MFKVLLTEEQWYRLACVADDDILLALVEGQPELAKRLGVEVVSTLKRPVSSPPSPASSDEGAGSDGGSAYQG